MAGTTGAYNIPPSEALFFLLPEEMKTKIFTHCFSSVSLDEGSETRNVRRVCRSWESTARAAERMMYIELQRQFPQGSIPLTDILGKHPSEIPKDDLSPEGSIAVKKVSQKMVEVAEHHGVILPEHTVFLNQTQLQEIQRKAQEQNSALELVWKKGLRQCLLGVPEAPQNEIPSADAPAATVRVFLRDPARAELLNKVDMLSLAFCPHVTGVPLEMGLLKGLKVLNLSHTDLRKAPDVSEYPLLEELVLGNTKIQKSPNVSKNPALRKLDLFNTKIDKCPDISANPNLQILDLAYTPIREVPDLSQHRFLTVLNLSNTEISTPPDISNNCALEGLSLSYTRIRETPNLKNNSKLRNLNLSHTQIREAPVIHEDTWVYELYLEDVPLMFIGANELSMLHFHDRALFEAQQRDPCTSPLAQLYQRILRQEETPSVISGFKALSQKDRDLIYEMVWEESGRPQTEDAQWGEHHIFDNMRLFHYAVQSAIFAKLDRLSEEQKNKVYGRIYELAQPALKDVLWGKLHAREHIPRLADALEVSCV